MKSFFNSLKICVICSTPMKTSDVCYCSFCAENLECLTQTTCSICLNATSKERSICLACQLNKPFYDKIVVAYKYAQPLSSLLHKVKYNRQVAYSRVLSQLFYARVIKQIETWPDVIIPVPLNMHKLWKRGFNQSEELLKYFKLKHKITTVNAVKLNHNDSQVGLDRDSREKNLSGSFVIYEDLTSKNVVLIDDVVTTGATVNELAKTCKLLGASNVQVWCFLRTILIGNNCDE
jgi:ComF family protein